MLNGISRAVMKSEFKQFYGIILAVLSSLCYRSVINKRIFHFSSKFLIYFIPFSLCSVIVKFLNDVSPVELSLFRCVGKCEISLWNLFLKSYYFSFRFLGVLLPSISYVIYKNENVFPEGKRKLLSLRCAVGAAGLWLSFYAFQNMDLGDSTVIIFSTPIFVAIFSRIFLGEKCGLFNIITISITVLGIIFVAKPPSLFSENEVDETKSTTTYKNYFLALIAALFSAIFTANAMIIIRMLRDLHHSVVICNFGIFASGLTFILLIITGGWCLPRCENRLLVVALSIFSFLGQIFLTISLRIEEAGIVSIARSTTIVFAFIWQIILFNQIPCLSSIFGALLIVFSVGLNALKKWALSNDTNVSRNIARLLKM
jgi:drug/metabolite transporter (DMT)-like permease